jgi:hypothetical protein
LYALPLLACLWANVHGSFLLGPGILVLYTIGGWLQNLCVNELESSATPLLAPQQGGVAAPINKKQRSLLSWAQMGWFSFRCGQKTTPAASASVATRHFFDDAATPPCGDARRGVTPDTKFVHTCIDRALFLLISVLSLLATFINPYGWRLHQHVLAYLQDDYLMDHISEFRSFSFHSPGAYYVELFLLVAVLGVIALLRQRAIGPALLGVGMLHMSLYSARHLPVAAVLLLPLATAALTQEARRFLQLRPLLDYSDRLRAIDRRILGAAPLAIVLIASAAGMRMLAQAGSVNFNPAVFPARAADFLEQNNLSARIFSKDQWGGYLIFRFGGRAKVFIDGRSDFYRRDFLETYAQAADVKPSWNTVLKQYGVGLVLIPPDHALASVLEISPDWKRIYSDSVAAIFERTG